MVIGDSVTSIGDSAFYSCSSLTSVVIGKSVTSIGWWAFNCEKLNKLVFTGTLTQWNAIKKDSDWNKNMPATKVVCSDGSVSL